MIKVKKKCRYGPMMYIKHDTWVGRSFHIYGEALETQIEVMDRFIVDRNKTLNRGTYLVDTCANIGTLVIPFANACEKIIAYEPHSYIYKLLCGNIAMNNIYNVETLWNAACDESKKCRYCLSPQQIVYTDGCEQNLTGDQSTACPRFDNDIYVETLSIDDLNVRYCDFIRCDSSRALQGAKNVIERFKPIIFFECDQFSQPRRSALVETFGYTYRSVRFNLFNKNNWFNYPINKLKQDGISMMSSFMICYHKDSQTEMDQIYFKAAKDLL